jgi:hypothetical protein
MDAARIAHAALVFGRIIRFGFGAFPLWNFHTTQFPASPEEGGVMRNVMLAFGSFAFGVLTTLLLGFGIPHTSIVRQPVVFAQSNAAPPAPLPPLRNDGLNQWTPVVPALPNTEDHDNFVTNDHPVTIQLDGKTMANDGFSGDVIFVYGGGEFSVANLKYRTATVTLVGAARNTMTFLGAFGANVCNANAPKPSPHVDLEAPRLKTIKLTSVSSGNSITASTKDDK